MNATQPQAGTAVLDGLVEGPLPPYPDGDDRLRQWTEFATTNGLELDLRIEGRSFSLLAINRPFQVPQHESLTDKLRQALDQLLCLFPSDLRSRVFSTVRSTEYREAEKVQAIYVVGPAGIQVREQRVDLPREPPAMSRSRRPIPLPWVVACLLALFALGTFAYQFDFRGFWRSLRTTFVGVDAEKIELDASRLARYLTFRKIGMERGGGYLEIEVSRTNEFPKDLAAFRAEQSRIEAANDLAQHIALTNLIVAGHVRISGLDKDGAVVFTREESVAGLHAGPSTRVFVPLRDPVDVVKLRLD